MSKTHSTRTGNGAGRHDPPTIATPEFSRLVDIGRIEAKGKTYEIEATPEECAALARRFDLEALHGLSAKLSLGWVREGGLARLDGRFVAQPVQRCVVTLDPVPARLEGTFTMFFSTEDEGFDTVVEVAVEEEDPPEPIVDDVIDIGEAVVQQFGVALDPYPRAPEAGIESGDADADETGTTKPFAGLSGLLKGKGR